MTHSSCHAVQPLTSLTDTKGSFGFRGCWTTSGPDPSLQEDSIATQQPGTKLTIISGALRGRRCIHVEDEIDKSLDSPAVPVPAFRVRLVTDDGEPGQSIVVGCHSVKVGW